MPNFLKSNVIRNRIIAHVEAVIAEIEQSYRREVEAIDVKAEREKAEALEKHVSLITSKI